MSNREKRFIIFYYCYVVVYLSLFFNLFQKMPNWLIALHLLGMVLSIIFVVIIVRDILKRNFSSPNAKPIWICLILFIWPISIYYVAKYGFRKRQA